MGILLCDSTKELVNPSFGVLHHYCGLSTGRLLTHTSSCREIFSSLNSATWQYHIARNPCKVHVELRYMVLKKIR